MMASMAARRPTTRRACRHGHGLDCRRRGHDDADVDLLLHDALLRAHRPHDISGAMLIIIATGFHCHVTGMRWHAGLRARTSGR